MRNLAPTVRHALNRVRRLTAGLAPTGRWPLALGIAATVLASTVGPTAPVRAATAPDPAARIQVIVKSLHIIDDTDWIGSGEEKLKVMFGGPTIDNPSAGEGGLAGFEYAFNASSGDDVPLDRLVPGDGESVRGGATAEAGIPVYAGLHYNLYIEMRDRDAFGGGDDMGALVAHVDEEHTWGIGTHTVRSLHNDLTPGDFTVTFEIRRVPLPDLLVTAFSVAGSPGAEFICGQVKNAGQQPSPPTSLTVQTEGKVVEQATVPALDVGGTSPQCVRRADLPAHQHNLVFSLDEARQLPEMDELNNVNFVTVQAIPGAAPVTAPSPQPAPTRPQAQTDFTVSAIRVTGQTPDGKNGCTADVAVTIKNAGSEPTDSFLTRLFVDGNHVDLNVDGLDAGQERDVKFAGVRLGGGEHTLRAVVDAGHAIDESNDKNNELKISARCKNGPA